MTETRIVRCNACGLIIPFANALRDIPLGHGQPEVILYCPNVDCGHPLGSKDKGVRTIGYDGVDVTSLVTRPCENCDTGTLHVGWFQSHDGVLHLDGAVCDDCNIFSTAPIPWEEVH